MKTFLCILSAAGLLLATGCTVEEHGRGGYYGPREYGHAEVHVDVHHGGYWERGHYYRY